MSLRLEKFLTPSTGKCSELKKMSFHFFRVDPKRNRYVITFLMHTTHWHPNDISPTAFVGKELEEWTAGLSFLQPMDNITFQFWLDVGVTMVILFPTALFPLLGRLREDVDQREGCRSLNAGDGECWQRTAYLKRIQERYSCNNLTKEQGTTKDFFF